MGPGVEQTTIEKLSMINFIKNKKEHLINFDLEPVYKIIRKQIIWHDLNGSHSLGQSQKKPLA